MHSDKNVQEKLDTIQTEFQEYQMSLYLFSFSSFLEVMLLENYDPLYLESIVDKVKKYELEYQTLISECRILIDYYSNSSIQSQLVTGFAHTNKIIGKAVSKVPVINKSKLENNLINNSARLEQMNSKKADLAIEQLTLISDTEIQVFIDNINTINCIFNKTSELLFDNDNIYISI